MNNKKMIYDIPCRIDRKAAEFRLSGYSNWFYEFNFTDGLSTGHIDSETNEIHQTRAELLLPFLDFTYQNRWNDITCLDIACNQGWFSTQIALRGARKIVGVDIREEHIEVAKLIKEISALDNCEYYQENFFNLDEKKIGQFDIALFLGILYHLDNPMTALKKLYDLTKSICIIETQVAKGENDLICKWGSASGIRAGAAIAVIDADETHAEKEQALALVPTLEALYKMIYSVGFDRAFLCIPPKSMHNQFVSFDRVMIIAQKLNNGAYI